MTNKIFDEQITLSLRRLEKLWQRADNLPKSSPQGLRQTDDLPTQPQELLWESLEELTSSLEELRVVVEELQQQNDELAQINREIEAERQRYQQLFELVPDGYLITTKEGVILEANQAAVELLKVPSVSLAGKPLAIFVAAEERHNFYSQLNQLSRGKSIKNWLVPIQHRQQADFIASFTVTPVQDLQNQVVSLCWRMQDFTDENRGATTVCVPSSLESRGRSDITSSAVSLSESLDVTEYKHSAVTTTEAQAKDEEFSKLKSQLFYVTTHELRNPLNTIFACADLIENNTRQGTEEKKQTYLQHIKVNVRRINQLLDDLLLMGKIEAGTIGVNPSLVDLNEFCRRLIAELQEDEGKEHKVTLINDYQASGIWDEKLLRRILKNLLLNAIKYSPKGSEIRLSITCEKGQVVFHIQDSGIGIPQQDQKFLFQALYRGSNVGKVPGSGLGLLIAKECAIAQGGEIAVESEENLGTTFIVTLPLNHRPGKSKKVNLLPSRQKNTNNDGGLGTGDWGRGQDLQ
ncbi:PAS domain-containing protein [Microcoleus sp. FACHB-SPT15]|uniref:PAS domain-containing sensor histidine kinase n=1 Tax=Microcoleus sp. FACHB-SPT15 TaxID=2692830 RepID=UPI00178190F6|nr:PAS domain-containing sensor histidine kinase [Microcoleus sp. FACHB-SPT15]MBD1804954.1 PAS domain-containing protein [Microcoleus sp. FACHB-SPT15]